MKLTLLLREIVFDTETTGTDHATGDRVVEIGALELVNHIPTGRTFHRYLNPQRMMSAGAFAVHGLSDEFLADKVIFGAVADELHAFFGEAHLVAHNATFDIGFLNAEFGRTGHAVLVMDRVIDTLALARRRHPNASNSLDALCLRYGVNNAKRTKHGALLDAELLAEVYLELIGGRQQNLGLIQAARRPAGLSDAIGLGAGPQAERPNRTFLAPTDREAHAAFVATLGGTPIWSDYLADAPG